MRLDVWLPTANPFATPEVLAAVAEEAESHRIGTIWVGEHVVVFDDYRSSYPYAADGRMPIPPDSGLLEPFTTLAFLAAQTSSVRLGTAMVLLPQRNPVYVGQGDLHDSTGCRTAGSTSASASGGWPRSSPPCSVPWPHRGRRCDEYLEVLRRSGVTRCPPSTATSTTSIRAACTRSRSRSPSPLHIGGESRAALERVARVGQGWHTFNRTPEQLAEPLGELDRLLAEAGRQRSDVRITVCPYMQPFDADLADRYAEAGADAVAALLLPLGVDGVREGFAQLETTIERLSRT